MEYGLNAKIKTYEIDEQLREQLRETTRILRSALTSAVNIMAELESNVAKIKEVE